VDISKKASEIVNKCEGCSKCHKLVTAIRDCVSTHLCSDGGLETEGDVWFRTVGVNDIEQFGNCVLYVIQLWIPLVPNLCIQRPSWDSRERMHVVCWPVTCASSELREEPAGCHVFLKILKWPVSGVCSLTLPTSETRLEGCLNTERSCLY